MASQVYITFCPSISWNVLHQVEGKGIVIIEDQDLHVIGVIE